MNLHCIDENRCGEGELSSSGRGAGELTHVQPAPGIPASIFLSKRQEEILLAACKGTPDKVIADNLGVSPRTLEGHWRAIHRKLGSTNRCQAGFIFAALREITRGKVPA